MMGPYLGTTTNARHTFGTHKTLSRNQARARSCFKMTSFKEVICSKV